MLPTLPAPLPLSIVIPTFNEAGGIGALLHYLAQAGATAGAGVEIIVTDGQSTDGTAALARRAGARVLACPQRGRAAQLNHGAAHATGDILYFLHADTRPPPGFLADIRRAVAAGCDCGCFRLRFDDPHWFLRANAWFTRFDSPLVRFGDQSLFVRRAVFEQAGGYRSDLLLLEDQEIVRRLRRAARWRVLPASVVTSARRYRANGVFRLQAVFGLLVLLYYAGLPQAALLRVYRALVR